MNFVSALGMKKFLKSAQLMTIRINGYFSGIDKQHIYFRPTIVMKHVNLDQLLFKFDNFGQDHLVSENLHGQLSGTLNGKIHMHADMTPKLRSEEHTSELQS